MFSSLLPVHFWYSFSLLEIILWVAQKVPQDIAACSHKNQVVVGGEPISCYQFRKHNKESEEMFNPVDALRSTLILRLQSPILLPLLSRIQQEVGEGALDVLGHGGDYFQGVRKVVPVHSQHLVHILQDLLYVRTAREFFQGVFEVDRVPVVYEKC
eukprot:TRINITY_DN1135_c0_g2_i8.p1 TRINITY_DN1135_c0_g2~~TRINITY_DN1135_c0_g2_i8.p1  ORF type:complete len:156 (+),score=3.87 TRINITY_DN1135_c0_g2_i8:105-572(+)